MIRILVAVMVALSLGVSAAFAQELDIPFEQYELDNGLQVILSRDASLPVAQVELWYHVGSKDEVPGRSGFAHLFEHLMFNGSLHWDDEYFAPLQPLGARINGSTTTERTNYFETVPANAVELALWMEADRMGFLLPALTIEKLNNQRDVVRNERRQNYEIRPYAKARKAIVEAVWPEGHPYHHLTIGSHEDLEAASMEDVATFFRTWYAPNNATLTVVGDFDVDQVKGWIERYFGPIPRGPEPHPITSAEAPLPEAQTIELTDAVKLPRLQWTWRSPAFFQPGDADLDVLSSVLTDGKSSRLYKRLVFEDRIAKDVSAYQASAGLGSTYNVVVTMAPGHDVAEAQAALQEELDRLVSDGVGTEELERARNGWKKMFFGRMERVAGRSSLLQSYNHSMHEPGWINKDLARYLAVTPDSLRAQAAATLVNAHRVETIVRPAADEGGE